MFREVLSSLIDWAAYCLGNGQRKNAIRHMIRISDQNKTCASRTTSMGRHWASTQVGQQRGAQVSK